MMRCGSRDGEFLLYIGTSTYMYHSNIYSKYRYGEE